jgi:hypothetical protein
MPMRAYRASTAHVSGNLSLWIVIFAVITAILGLARWFLGGGEHLGDLAALSGMVLGTLIMMKSQEGYVSPGMEDEYT